MNRKKLIFDKDCWWHDGLDLYEVADHVADGEYEFDDNVCNETVHIKVVGGNVEVLN